MTNELRPTLSGHVLGHTDASGLYTGRMVHYAVPDTPAPGTDPASARIIRQEQEGVCLAAVVVRHDGQGAADLGLFAPAGLAMVHHVPHDPGDALAVEEAGVVTHTGYRGHSWHPCGPGECIA